MNEIRNIHLGRQAYTVSADAYKELHDYLAAIQRKVGKEVAEEVELRMAELLAERGVTAKKVVLGSDVEYLKQQLGTPGDFSGDDAEDDSDAANKAAHEDDAENRPKRLFRDADKAMIAGVAAGLAKYLDIDVVIVRLIFVALTFFGGSGILVYAVLWLLVPEAKTNSERLQMRGMAVNVENIKRLVSDVDVPGATRRVSGIVGKVITRIAYGVLAIIGIGFMLGGLGVIIGAAVASIYGVVRGVNIGNTLFFPKGAEEITLLLCASVIVGLTGGLLAASGLALARRKWTMPGWAIAAVVGAFVVALSLGGALGADVGPKFKQRYQSIEHSRSIAVQPIKQMHLLGTNVQYRITPAGKPSVEIRSLGNVDTRAIQITQKDGVLTIDTRKQPAGDCTMICPYDRSNVEVVVHAPHAQLLPFDASADANVDVLGDDPYTTVYQNDKIQYLAPKPVRPSIDN